MTPHEYAKRIKSTQKPTKRLAANRPNGLDLIRASSALAWERVLSAFEGEAGESDNLASITAWVNMSYKMASIEKIIHDIESSQTQPLDADLSIAELNDRIIKELEAVIRLL